MSKCFISYRHVNPDEELANHLENFLSNNNHHVFIDNQILVGDKWAEKIDKQIRESNFFIVLLSPKSIESDMVVQEVKLAHQLSQRAKKPMVILPIRVDFEGELSYELGAYLDRIQYTLWKNGSSFNDTCNQILKAIENNLALPMEGKDDQTEPSVSSIKELFDFTEGRGIPLPAADPRFMLNLELESGTMKLDSPFYIRRRSDDKVESLVVRQGTTTIVKAPRQMGKSSLLARAGASASKLGISSCYIDFQMIDNDQMCSLVTLLEYLARKFARAFKAGRKPEDVWDSAFGAKESLTEFVEDALLSQTQIPILVLMDEVDRLFEFDFRDDFFALIRSWHNKRAHYPAWNKFNILIAHSTEPYLWIQNINQSPFNVGVRISLEDFNADHLAQLNKLHHFPLKNEGEILELLALVGGQPYLVRQALVALVNKQCSLNELCDDALAENGPFRDHLRRILWCLQQNEALKKSLRQIIRQNRCDDETHFQILNAAGLTKGEDRMNSSVRCRLYEEFFRRHL